MLSAFKYRLYPKPEQEMRLKRSLLSLCNLYNLLREKKIEAYRDHLIALTRTDLRAAALATRRENPEFESIHSQVVQNVADRVYVAFKNFFEGKSRFPKIKASRKYLSMTYPQYGFELGPENHLHVFGVGLIRIFLHRPLVGKVKRLSIKHEAGEWYAIFITNRETPPKRPFSSIPMGRMRGADLGFQKFAVFDNENDLRYPAFSKKSEPKIKRLHRRLALKKPGSKRWRQTSFKLARLYLHVKRQRDDWQNRRISEIFEENDVLVLERLNVKGMLKRPYIAKPLSDASMGKFARKCFFKAMALGKYFLAVDPWGTTQYCYRCLTWVPKRLAERYHACPSCGLNIGRDLNSARLIKRLGILSSPPSDGGCHSLSRSLCHPYVGW